jgi:hypothetical protein
VYVLPLVPPEIEGEGVVETLDATGVELATGTCDADEDAADDPSPTEPEAAPDDEAPQFPVNPVPDFVEVPVTSGPGLGKTTS